MWRGELSKVFGVKGFDGEAGCGGGVEVDVTADCGHPSCGLNLSSSASF